MTATQLVSVFVALALSTAAAIARGTADLTGKELCQRLTADEVTAVVGARRTAEAGDERCTFVNPSSPAIRLINSPSDTREEFIELVQALKGTVQDGPGGSVLSSVAFDLKNGTISAAWFMLDKTPVELEFDRGIEREKARALVEAARR